MRKRLLGGLVVTAFVGVAVGAQVPISKAQPAVSLADRSLATSKIPAVKVTFKNRDEARRLNLADLVKPAQAVRAPRFTDTVAWAMDHAVGGVKADAKTGKVWIVMLNDGPASIPQWQGYAGFTSPAFIHGGRTPLESVSISVTANVREYLGTGLRVMVIAYADGVQIRSARERIVAAGELTCTLSGLRLEPGKTYHAAGVLDANAGGGPGTLVAARDAEITAIRWTF